jgi:hypothetical protein
MLAVSRVLALVLALVLGPAHPLSSPAVERPQPPRVGGSGEPCSLDRHCGLGLGCHVPSQRCATVAEIERMQRSDRRGDIAFVVPTLIVGVAFVSVGAVFAAREQVPVAAVGLSVGSLLTLIGIGGAVAIGIKRERHQARLREISRRLGLR